MSAERFEAFLAKLYVDDRARSRFIADPRGEVLNAGLTDEDCKALQSIDLIGLELAADSFARKRAHQISRKKKWRSARWFRRG